MLTSMSILCWMQTRFGPFPLISLGNTWGGNLPLCSQIGLDGFQYLFCHCQLFWECRFSTQSPTVRVESQKYLHFSTTMHLYLGQDNQTPIYSSMMGFMWRFKLVHNATSVALIQVLEWLPSLFVRRCYSKLLHIQDPVLLWQIFFFGLHRSACHDGGCLISVVVSCT